jgi:hypothetical protein
LGWVHNEIALGAEPIEFPHLRVAPAKKLRLRMPGQTMLCTLWARAFVPDGTLVAANYLQFFVDAGAPSWQQLNRRTVYRLGVESWSRSDWNATISTREEAARIGSAHGSGRGWFEWKFPAGPDVLHGRGTDHAPLRSVSFPARRAPNRPLRISQHIANFTQWRSGLPDDFA